MREYLVVEKCSSNKQRSRGYGIARNLAEEALPCVSRLLGKLHGVDQSQMFWEPIIGIWLRHFTVVYVDRLKEHHRNQEKERNSSVSSVSIENWSPPLDWADFYAKHGTPGFHSELSSQIQYFHNCKGVHRFMQSMEDRINLRTKNMSGTLSRKKDIGVKRKEPIKWLRSVLKLPSPKNLLSLLVNLFFALAKTIIYYVSAALYRDKLIVICSQFLDRKSILKFAIQSYGQVVCYPTILSSKSLRFILRSLFDKKECNKRVKLAALAAEMNNTDYIFMNVLIQQIPRIHVEDFQEVHRLSKLAIIKSPLCVYADGLQHIDETFKISVGSWRLNGTKLLFGQHGGNWVAAIWDSLFDQDLATASTCYTWGWKDDHSTLKPMPSIRLSLAKIRHNQFNSNFNQKRILYVCRTTFSNQQGTFDYTLRDVRSIKAGRKRLSEIMPTQLKKEFLIRPRPSDLLGNNSNSVEEFESSGFELTPSSAQISALFADSKVVIFEGLSTGFFECLAIDKPAVLFVSDNYFPFETSSAKELRALLEEFGIIFKDVMDLMHFLNMDITEWWHSDSRKCFREELKNRFALTSDNYIKEWIRELQACPAIHHE